MCRGRSMGWFPVFCGLRHTEYAYYSSDGIVLAESIARLGVRNKMQWPVVSEEGWKTGGRQSRRPENEKTGREEGREAVAGGPWGRMGNHLNHGLKLLEEKSWDFYRGNSYRSFARSLSRSLSIRLIAQSNLTNYEPVIAIRGAL